MKQRTWPSKSKLDSPFIKKQTPLKNHPTKNPFIKNSKIITPTTSSSSSSSNSNNHDFSQLPYDVLLKLAATFTAPNLRTASLVCKSWFEALKPLRESMLFLSWGKRFKHGRNGVKPNLIKALDSFLKGAARGSTLAMVDAGLVYWEIGRREEGTCLYRKAAELGDPVGQCNLGISLLQGAARGSTLAMVDAGLVYQEIGRREEGIGLYRKAAELSDPSGQCNLGISLLQANPPDPEEAVKWLYKASVAGHVRAQYQLALSLHKGRGPNNNLQEAAKWYLRAAEGGYVRAMYNTALCYSVGEGLMQSDKLARKWMMRAANRGHSKAQLEHGRSLFSEGEMMRAVVYLELAARAGEAAADPVKNVILQQMSASSRDRAMLLANIWRPLPPSH
ncbi:F-box protein At1g70590-like isoform X2 [Lycium barbarum]|uniref:F-box protein At1g70590-like isoform X2 n=1 Tax=Lycium barbarum TaxID=112863 RepID=UPI00293F26C8|nr:F-box protein At1g70590-like isoform X2 [Lycium barbarum]